MNNKRPINLDLRTIHFPIMAIASIFHRISGVLLFLLLPFMLYFLQLSLGDEASTIKLNALLILPFYKLIIWLFLAAFFYHILAGIRHLLMDMNIGEDLKDGRNTAFLVIGLSIVLTILLGFWIW